MADEIKQLDVSSIISVDSPSRVTFTANDPQMKLLHFNVNEGIPRDSFSSNICRLPDIEAITLEDYTANFVNMSKASGGLLALAKDFQSSMPPNAQSFSKISYLPNSQSSNLGVLQWPGLPPATIEKLAHDMIGFQTIIFQRMNDIMRFSQKSSQSWRPGWRLVPKNGEPLNNKLKKEIAEAEDWLQNSGFYTTSQERDRALRCSFSKFLSEMIRNSLTFDGVAIWTDRRKNNMIESYCLLPAQQIRLLARADEAQLKEAKVGLLSFYGISTRTGKDETLDVENPPFAVIIDQTNNVVESFTHDQLFWYTRNPRIDLDVGGYGFPEIEIALTLVTGINNALTFNASLFDKNSIPKAILLLKGNFTQKQLDALGRMWDNLQRGGSSQWTLPAIQISEKGEISLISLEPLRNEPVYYNNLINLFMGMLAALYCIPAHRLGYKISGTERDTRPDTPKPLMDSEDVGLPVLLTHLEHIFNDGILPGSRFPHLVLEFTGRSPKEDARLYEVSLLTKTVDERRSMVGDPPLIDLIGKDDNIGKMMAGIMGNAPVDPSLSGIYQSIIAGMVKAGLFGGDDPGKNNSLREGGDNLAIPGARFTSRIDPSQAEAHGHVSGIRRDSRAESATGKKPPNLRRTTDTNTIPATKI